MIKTGKPGKKNSRVVYLEIFLDIFRKNMTAKIIFFAIGSVLWFNINLQKDFEASVNIPIVVSNIQRGKTLLYPVPEEARIKIRSKGRNLILSDLGKDIFFEIDASGISDSALIRLNSDFFINTSGKELEPLFIFHPQEVRIILDDYASKKVPVDLQSSYSMAAGYVTSGPFVLEPDSIEISGPKSRVEKIQSVKTAKMHDRDLTEDFSREIDLLTNGFPTVKYSENKVEAYQKIVRKGSVTFKVPVNLINIPEGKSILIEPIAVDITVEGPVNELQKMTAGDFYAEADVSQMDNITNRMPLQVTTSIGLKWGQNTTEIRAVLY